MKTPHVSHAWPRSSWVLSAILILLCLSAPSPSSAADLEKPCTGSHDWVRLTSSEWLKGDLRRMRYRYLDFWSREMKSQRIKWRKVAELCMARDARFVRKGYSVFVGRGVVRDDSVIVETKHGEVRFPREELTAVLRGTESELDRWGIHLGLGVDANVGNTEQTAVNLSGAIRREDRFTRAEVEYTGTIGTASGEQNINRHRVASQVDWFFTRQLYWTVLTMPAVYDRFKNIDLQLSPSTGIGWQVFDRSGLEWSLEGGIGYQYSSFISVQAQQAPTASDAVLRLGTSLSWDIISNLELKLDHTTTFIPTDPGLTTLYTRAALKYEITWLLKLETAIIHNRTFEPVRRADGSRPEADDMQLIMGFSFDTY